MTQSHVGKANVIQPHHSHMHIMVLENVATILKSVHAKIFRG